MFYLPTKNPGQGEVPEWYGPTNPASMDKRGLVRWTTFAYTDAIHLWLLVWPARFCPDWRSEVPVIEHILDPRVLGAIAFVVLLAAAVLYSVAAAASRPVAQRSLAPALALLWLVAPFLPAANIFFYVGASSSMHRWGQLF